MSRSIRLSSVQEVPQRLIHTSGTDIPQHDIASLQNTNASTSNNTNVNVSVTPLPPPPLSSLPGDSLSPSPQPADTDANASSSTRGRRRRYNKDKDKASQQASSSADIGANVAPSQTPTTTTQETAASQQTDSHRNHCYNTVHLMAVYLVAVSMEVKDGDVVNGRLPSTMSLLQQVVMQHQHHCPRSYHHPHQHHHQQLPHYHHLHLHQHPYCLPRVMSWVLVSVQS
jgi:hypothetical protein